MKPSIEIVLLCLGCLSCGSSGCRNDWMQFGESCYAFLDEVVSWSTATEMCSSLRSRLVEVNNKAENDFVASQLRVRNQGYSWLGIQDFLHETRWVTTSDGQPLTFANWKPGEPNNQKSDHEGGEDCAVLLGDGGLWNDYPCGNTRVGSVVCEHKMEWEEIVG